MEIKFTAKSYLNVFAHTALGINAKNWFSLLRRNNFNIHPGFIPKALFITGNVILNIPVQLYEHLRYRKTLDKVKVKAPVFIIGHHRSGTTYLHHMLSNDPEFTFCTTYEALTPYIFLTGGKTIERMLDKSMPDTRPQDNVKIGASLPTEEEFAMANISQTSFIHGFYFPRSIFKTFDESVLFKKEKKRKHWQERMDFLIRKILLKKQDKTLLLKSPANTGRIKEILELYPDARFIHIHRNPYEVFVSFENLFKKVLPLLSFQKTTGSHLRKFIFYSYAAMYKKYLKEKPLIPQAQLIEIPFTDFVNEPLKELKEAYRKLSLGDYAKAKESLAEHQKKEKDYKKNIYDTIDPESRKIINDEWGFFFKEYGYKIED